MAFLHDGIAQTFMESVDGVPFVPGSRSEYLIYRVAHLGMVQNQESKLWENDTRGHVRYLSPHAYFQPQIKELENRIAERESALLKAGSKWGEDAEDDKKILTYKTQIKQIREQCERQTGPWLSRKMKVIEDFVAA